jgi:hypothetical protein
VAGCDNCHEYTGEAFIDDSCNATGLEDIDDPGEPDRLGLGDE